MAVVSCLFGSSVILRPRPQEEKGLVALGHFLGFAGSVCMPTWLILSEAQMLLVSNAMWVMQISITANGISIFLQLASDMTELIGMCKFLLWVVNWTKLLSVTRPFPILSVGSGGRD